MKMDQVRNRSRFTIEAFIHSLRTIIYCTARTSLKSPFRSGSCKRWSV